MPTRMYVSVEKLAFTVGERSDEYKICVEQDLRLVCRGSHHSTDLAGGYLDGDPCQ